MYKIKRKLMQWRLYKLKWRLLLLISLIILYSFILDQYRSRCTLTHPETLLLQSEDYLSNTRACQVDLAKLDRVDLDITITEFDDIVKKHRHVQKGGHWKPSKCEALQKVAVIIPYRDRYRNLQLLVNRLHGMLTKQMIDYRIFVVEQDETTSVAWLQRVFNVSSKTENTIEGRRRDAGKYTELALFRIPRTGAGDDLFNKGKLMNIGYLEALKYDDYGCFVFHDVDLLPENDKNLYMCNEDVRHLTSAVDEFNYLVWYCNFAGGGVAVNRYQFRKINGFSNSYWGWGQEDDDFAAR